MDHQQYITNESERKSGKHLTSEDRGAIQAIKKLNCSNRTIASYLHCSPTIVSIELKCGTPTKKSGRGRTPSYSVKRAKAVYQANRKNCRKPHKINRFQKFVRWVLTQMRQCKWSIDACVGYARKHKLFPSSEIVCTKTLYNEIWAGNIDVSVMEFPEALKRKKHRNNNRKNKKCYGTSIEERPEVVNSRAEKGH